MKKPAKKNRWESPTWRSCGKLGSMVSKWIKPLVFKGGYIGVITHLFTFYQLLGHPSTMYPWFFFPIHHLD